MHECSVYIFHFSVCDRTISDHFFHSNIIIEIAIVISYNIRAFSYILQRNFYGMSIAVFVIIYNVRNMRTRQHGQTHLISDNCSLFLDLEREVNRTEYEK